MKLSGRMQKTRPEANASCHAHGAQDKQAMPHNRQAEPGENVRANNRQANDVSQALPPAPDLYKAPVRPLEKSAPATRAALFFQLLRSTSVFFACSLRHRADRKD